MIREKKGKMTRRKFVVAGAAAATTVVSGFPFVRTSRAQNVEPIKVGLVGCGGRGTGAADECLNAAPNMHLVALADLFPDRIERCKNLLTNPKRRGGPLPGFEVKNDHCFSGFNAFERLLETDVDYVILAEPPGFRPDNFTAAVNAGKHVFMEKPVAVDPVGVRKVIEAGRRAKQKGLGVVAGTQRRHQKSYRDTIKRIHDGAIGEILSAQCYWIGDTGYHENTFPNRRDAGWTDMEWQIRNWYYFCWLSGDHIVEQHVHNIDVINWVLGTHPVKALGVGGRQVRTGPLFGSIYDHFAVDFEYPDEVLVMSMCRQMAKCDNRVSEFIVGNRGKSNPNGEIAGANEWKFRGKSPNPYVQEHADLIESIRNGNPLNEAQNVAESVMTAIMGRESAYTGKEVTWDEMMNSDLDLFPKKLEFGPISVRPVPMPGQPRPR